MMSGHDTPGGSVDGSFSDLDISQPETEQMLFRQEKFVLGSLFTFRNLHTPVVARKMM